MRDTSEKRTSSTLLAVLLAFALITAACFGGDDDDESTDAGGDSSAQDIDDGVGPSGVPTDETIADNGYGDVTLGRTLGELVDQYGAGAFELIEEADDGASIYTIPDIPELRLVFADGVLGRVDVLDAGLPSINGGHEVGDPIADVLSRYEERIENGARIAVTCSDQAVIARARQAYRLVFYVEGDSVSRISSLGQGRIEPGTPCEKIDAPIVDNVVEPPEPPTPITVADFVPDPLGTSELLLRDPSMDKLPLEFGLVWSYATEYYKTLNVIDMVSSVASCLYDGDPQAVAVGVYKPGQLVVAVAVQHVATITNATCVLFEVVIPIFACENCAVVGPAVDGYLADIDGVTYAVAYGTIRGGTSALTDMCDALPHCPDTTLTTVPADMVTPGGA